jgi:hypothetical protein
MAQSVEETGHPSSMRAEWLEQLHHLVVCSTGPASQVIDHDVLEMKVAHVDLIGVAMGYREGLRHRPESHPLDRDQLRCRF